MSESIDPLSQLVQTWGKLSQAGFSPIWESYKKWAHSIEAYQLGQSQVSQTSGDIIWRHGRTYLIHYHPATQQQYPIPILIIPSLINRYYILDLMPNRSLIKFLVESGFNVYLLDWGRPTSDDVGVTFDAHISEYMHRAVEKVSQDTNVEQVTLLGYCMGGLLTAVYTALYPERVANLVNLAGPIGFDDDGIFSLMTRSDWFDADQLVNTYGNIPADLLCWVFQMIRPTSHLVRALFFYERMEDDDFVRSFAAMQTWIFDQVDFPGETFRRYIKDLYQENQLVNGAFTINDQPVWLANITCPLLNIGSKQDETAPYESVIILNEMVSSEENDLLELRGPHVGMVAGRGAPKYFWPKLAEWLELRSGSLG
jgi:polyhydroxyalkanoate synthase subunit PhaC